MNLASLPPGTDIGPWRLMARQGQGSYGVVYRVERVGAVEARPFALKLALHPLDPRFEREAELLSRIRHPQVPRLEDRGWWVLPGGVPFPYLVMEWIEGVPLYEWAAGQALTSRQATRVLAQVARALEATHMAGGVHRDVKGDNVLVREDGSAVLIDFGSGNYQGARPLTHQPPPPGTPQYQSPESLHFQWHWRASKTARYEAMPADDVYAMGVTAYRLVTGRYPSPTVDVEETEEEVRLIDLPQVPPETWVSLSPELAALIHQMLSPEPSARGSAAEMAEALEHEERTAGPMAAQPIRPLPARAPAVRRTLPAPPRPALTWSRWLAVAVSAALVISAWWAGHQSPGEGLTGVAQAPRGGGNEDRGTTGLAESVRSVPSSVAPPEPAQAGIGLDVPKKAFQGQRRPPCQKPVIEINGGCWIRYGDATPPCGAGSYAWKNACYLPILAPPRPTTSGQP